MRIREEPVLDVPVATPAGLVRLRLVPWSDPVRHGPDRDAKDIAHLLRHCEQLPSVGGVLAGDRTDILETHDTDLTLAAAHLLGVHANDIARPETRRHVARLAGGDRGGKRLDRLEAPLCGRIETQ